MSEREIHVLISQDVRIAIGTEVMELASVPASQ